MSDEPLSGSLSAGGRQAEALEDWGWHPFFEAHLRALEQPGLEPGRVVRVDRHLLRVQSRKGELQATVPGAWLGEGRPAADLPATGDWVAVETLPTENQAVVRAVLPRRTQFSRKVPGTHTIEQVLAANIDTVLLVSGLDGDFNLRRLERFLLTAWESGAQPVILLNKADACDEVEARRKEVEAIAAGLPVHVLSALTGAGLEPLQEYRGRGRTLALLGSSGVGKSTLVNRWLGADYMKVASVREDDSRGRHTTSHRELVRLPDGTLVLDTPGLRELQLWGHEEGLADTFADIAELAAGCRFRDCAHEREPGCAVRAAVESGELDPGRFESYRKLQRELAFLERRQREYEARAEQRRWGRMHKRVMQERRKGR